MYVSVKTGMIPLVVLFSSIYISFVSMGIFYSQALQHIPLGLH